MLFDLGGILTSVGYSQSITFKSYPRDFPWVMIILHPSWSENIRISYAFFPLKINSGIVVQTDKLYEKS